MTRFLLDRGLPRSTTRHLEQLGIRSVHAPDIGLSRAADSEIVREARSRGFAIVTLDADFHALIALSGQASPTVIRIRREGMDGARIAASIADVMDRLPEAISRGAQIAVTERSIRLRHLPIERRRQP